MLQHTWDRADQLTDPHHKVTVLARPHKTYIMPDMQHTSTGQLLFQPNNRDTAAGVFLPLTYVREWNPEATVIVYPSDHFVYPEDHFIENVHTAVRATEHWSDRIFTLGASPTRMEGDYGWIEKKRRLGWAEGTGIWSVESFKEKPSSGLRWSTTSSTWLWNTMVVVAKLNTLWEAGWDCFPDVMERFTALGKLIGTQREGTMLSTIYDDMPCKNFSADLLGRSIEHFGVIEMPNLLWSDWGRPGRIMETLKEIGKVPTFSTEHMIPHDLNQHVPNEVSRVG